MPVLEQPSKNGLVKMLIIGDSSTGKTGSLCSLLKAGYRLRVLDLDNKIKNGILPHAIAKDCPDKMANLDYEPLRDKFRGTAGGHVFDGMPQAYIKALALMDKWSDGSIPKKWGPDVIFVLDSLTFFADAAFNWAKSMSPGTKDPRQWYGTAQDGVQHTLGVLSSDDFETNVIVISHVLYQERPDGTMKGFPSSVGKAIGPDIPTYFDNMALTQTIAGGKRVIQTIPTALIDLKNAASFKMAPTYPIETGLAEFFKTLRS